MAKEKTLSENFGTATTERRYFYWRNSLKSKFFNFKDNKISEEEFIKQYLKGNKKEFERLKNKEDGVRWNYSMKLMYKEQAEEDFLTMYESVRKKALEGDNVSVKTFLMLQRELKNNMKQNKENKENIEDDGLEIN